MQAILYNLYTKKDEASAPSFMFAYRQIYDDLIQCAVQYFTQRVQRVGRHRFAGFQSSYRGAADPPLNSSV